jgi:mRNA interferase YafQ
MRTIEIVSLQARLQAREGDTSPQQRCGVTYPNRPGAAAVRSGPAGKSLSGNWAGYRECHLKPDLLLIYCKPDASTLRLARLGSHSELFA